jgi:hypothetical protein
MGMDVMGKNPTDDQGNYFRNNVWWWRPLWDYVVDVAPHLTEGVDGHMNGGDGLAAAAAEKLAALLTAELDAGRTAEYAAAYMATIEAMPDQPCWLCGGTGIRDDATGRANGMLERLTTLPDGTVRKGWCNACAGTGAERPREAHYPFSVENVVEFRDFVAASGGFEIW